MSENGLTKARNICKGKEPLSVVQLVCRGCWFLFYLFIWYVNI